MQRCCIRKHWYIAIVLGLNACGTNDEALENETITGQETSSLASASLPIYADALQSGFTDQSWGTRNLGATSPVHTGSKAISFEPDSWNGLQLQAATAFRATDYSSLVFWVHGGSTGGQRVRVILRQNSNTDRRLLLNSFLSGGRLAANQWTRVTIPTSSFGATDLIKSVIIQDDTGGNQSAIYIDDMMLEVTTGPTPTPTPTPTSTPTPTPTPTPTATPSAALTVYDDSLRNNFIDWSWCIRNLSQTSVVHSGSRAISMEPDYWQGLQFANEQGVALNTIKSIRFWIHGGSTGGQSLGLTVETDNSEASIALTNYLPGGRIPANQWAQVEVPLSALALRGTSLRAFYLQDRTGGNQGTLYVDDVALVSSGSSPTPTPTPTPTSSPTPTPTPSPTPTSPPTSRTTMYINGRHLYDTCGRKVILRGVNKMNIWTDPDGSKSFAEIAKTGANAIRIVWDTNGSAGALDTVIARAISNGLLPMVELHGATGNWSRLSAMVDYWVRSDVVAVLNKYKRTLLVNIANEVGDGSISDASFRSGYSTAVQRMRSAGLHMPLVIDGTQWGQNIDILQANGPYLQNQDVDHNLMFSVHTWWVGRSAASITSEINQSVLLNLPLVVGEFAHKGVGCSCCIDYKTILAACQSNEIGWLAWEWGPGNGDCSEMDMTPNNLFTSLWGWALEVAVTDPNSIRNTAKPVAALRSATCN